MADLKTFPQSCLSLSSRCGRETTLPLDARPRHSAADRRAILRRGLFLFSSSPAGNSSVWEERRRRPSAVTSDQPGSSGAAPLLLSDETESHEKKRGQYCERLPPSDWSAPFALGHRGEGDAKNAPKTNCSNTAVMKLTRWRRFGGGAMQCDTRDKEETNLWPRPLILNVHAADTESVAARGASL